MSVSSSAVSIRITAHEHLNLALVHSHAPLLRELLVTNRTDSALHTLTVHVSLAPLAKPLALSLPSLKPGASWRLEDVALSLDAKALVDKGNLGRRTLEVRVRAGEELVGSASLVVEVLPPNSWRLDTDPSTLAALVLSTHPRIREVVAQIDGRLEQARAGTSAPTTLAYIQGLYQTLVELGLKQTALPADWEKLGLLVDNPEQTLHTHSGNSLELAVLTAALAECLGFHPVIVLIDRHAFIGIWLSEAPPGDHGFLDAQTLLYHVQMADLAVFDPAAATHTPVLSFEAASALALAYLEEEITFRFALDLRTARNQGYLPLPGWVFGLDNDTHPTARPAPKRAKSPPTHDRVRKWQAELLDLTLRNRLLHFNVERLGIPLTVSNLALLEDRLVKGRGFQILGTLHAGPEPASSPLEHFESGFLTTSMTPESLDSAMIRLERKSRASFEEAGDHTLFLALGLLRWIDQAKMPRCAPLLMVPIALQRRTNRASWQIGRESEATVFNPSLIEKLRADYAIDLTCYVDELPGDDYGIDVPQVFEKVRREIQSMPQWRLDESAVLGQFSFTKQVMWRDLERVSTTPEQGPILQALTQVNQAFPDGGGVPTAATLDADFPPETILCPLDADASQLAAVLAAAGGESFVLQGPPGTGKSQTITNLITHCLAKGKTVLFVAAKMAALQVVHKRLQLCQVGSFCLELHSHAANKKSVVDQMGQALELAPDMDSEKQFRNHCTRLERERTRLNTYCESMNRERECGWSMRALITRLLDLAHETKLGLSTVPSALSRTDLGARLERIQHFADRASQTPQAAEHPLRWVGQTIWTPFFQEDFENHLRDLERHCAVFAEATASLASWLALELERLPLPELRQLLDLLLLLPEIKVLSVKLALAGDREAMAHQLADYGQKATRRIKLDQALKARYHPSFYHLELRTLRSTLLHWSEAFAPLAWWMLRATRRQLRAVTKSQRLPSTALLLEDLQCGIDVIELDHQLDQAPVELQPLLLTEAGLRELAAQIDQGKRLASALDALNHSSTLGPTGFARKLGERILAAREAGQAMPRAAHEAALALHDWLEGLNAKQAAFARLSGERPTASAPATVDGLRQRWREALANADRLRDWCLYQAARTAIAHELEAVVIAASETGQLQAPQLAPAFERAYLFHRAQELWKSDAHLHGFDSAQHGRAIDKFRELDSQLGALAGSMALLELRRRVPAGPKAEMDFLRRELAKKIRHPPIRRFFERIPTLRERLKPCMLMSPLSVAQYLTPETRFDIVIFDEASQIPTAEAIGAVARGRQLIVVGDSRQLPPTRFFERAVDPENDRFADQPEELESILDECSSAGLRELRLDWHYRSQHEHLIAFSNRHYYEGRLQTFPSADNLEGRIGVSRQAVPNGEYQRGSRVNLQEAQAVVAEVIRRLEHPLERMRSLGIVTFSAPQQALIEDLLEEIRFARPEFEPFFTHAVSEPIFVKNLENVQGDERDVILFSICYGPDAQGKVWMNFGPLNQDGGERRLNVAVTRARQQLVVFSTLTADQIDLKRTRATGVKHLRLFLDYAERGPQSFASGSDPQSGSSIEARIQAALSKRGHQLVTQVGCSDYRIDLAVHDPSDPNRFLLGIECDGPAYAGAKVARDRDRLRQELLSRLGWRLLRVWTIDWWTQPQTVLDHIEHQIEEALKDRGPRQLSSANASLP